VKSWSKRSAPLVALCAAAITIAACDEQLSGGIGCPVLCPAPPTSLRDTVIPAVDLDTSIAGYPTFGLETNFLLASLGDTLETAAIFRFDSLLKTYRRPSTVADSDIVFVDTGAYVRLSLVTLDTVGDPTTFELYNVDMGGPDDVDPLAVTAAFTADRLIGTRTVPADSMKGEVRIPIDPAFLLSRIQSDSPGDRVRVGVRVAATGNPRAIIIASQGNGTPQLIFRPAPDSASPVLETFLFSKTPDDNFFIASALADYLVVLKEPPPPAADAFRVGGLPARRVYLRFNIPSSILDSANVVRATLVLTQRPNAFAPRPLDTVGVGHFGVVAGGTITDLSKALAFLQRINNRDTLQVLPTDSADRTFEMVDWVRTWRSTTPEKTPRAIGLAISQEGLSAGQVDFFSLEASPEVRPRLRLTYLPRSEGPLP
jgi:hypothetical protein